MVACVCATVCTFPGMKLPRFPHTVRRGSVAVKVYRVHRAGGREVFTASWHSAGVRYTRQFPTASAAIEEATLQADQLAAGRSDVLTSGVSAEDAHVLAALREKVGEVPLTAAIEEWVKARALCGGQLIQAAKAWRDMHAEGVKAITVPAAVEAFLAHKRKEGVDVGASYETILPRLKERFTGPIATVTRKALETWIEDTFRQPGAEEVHRGTYATARKRLVALWRWCRAEDYLPKVAHTEAERLPKPRRAEECEEIGILRVVDFASVLELARGEHPQHLAVAVLAGFTGLRRSELHAQRWADVNLAEGYLRVSSVKRNTPSKRHVPLCAAAVEWLMLCEREEGAELVSPPWGLDRVRTFVRGAKIQCPENGFRHSFISHLVAKTGNVAETALAAGNSPAVVHAHYRALVPKAEGAAWFDLTPAQAATIAAGKIAKMKGAANA